MTNKKPNELTALEALIRIKAGSLTSEALVEACLQRVSEREKMVGAWKFISPDQARKTARNVDKGTTDRPLCGVPIGVKDLFDTVDMPTSYGSPIYEGNRPSSDASAVARTRVSGGVILGKTITTEFALFEPGKTTNPHNPNHTPGGSSSGSAAAVADCMVPLALGSQSVGSTIRPASYCGVVGYKPSFGLVDCSGIRPLIWSFDTVGVFSRSVSDAAYFISILSRRQALRLEGNLETPPRIGFCRTPEWSLADQDTENVLKTAARLATASGAQVRDITLPEPFPKLAHAQGVIADFEVANSAAYELTFHRDLLSGKFVERADAGVELTIEQYDEALSIVAAAQAGLDSAMDDVDVLLCPSATGEAPEGLGATGDPIFNRLGTALRVPCVNIPGLSGHSGLPVGVQVIGRMMDDRRTLAVGEWLHNILKSE